MTAERVYLAIDLGASSGRVLAGIFDGKKLSLEEIHRFSNGGVRFGNHLYWNVLELWKHIQAGLKKASAQFGNTIRSLGVDTWGVDFALLDRKDELLGNPYCYRDSQFQGTVAVASQIVSCEEIFQETGLQFMDINTLFQLHAMKRSHSTALENAHTFLMIPDLFNFLLTGEKVNEFTDATTSQFLNPRTRDWSRSLLERLEIPTEMLQPIAQPGTNLGKLRKTLAADLGLGEVDVVLPGTHDTASAVMAVPASGQQSTSPNWCYISSGTWSLLGAEVTEPVINEKCREFNFTNEGGVGGTIRLLKNITGLWLVQECRRIWAGAGHDYSWQELTEKARNSTPLATLIDPDDPRFATPTDMPNAIRSYCRESGQTEPANEGAVIRCALESMALKYRKVMEMLETLTGSNFETIHIVGGGTQNRDLCQMAADACHKKVVAGPVEATAIGNVMMQAISCGDVDSVKSARQIVKSSFQSAEYEPQQQQEWDEAFAQFIQLKSPGG